MALYVYGKISQREYAEFGYCEVYPYKRQIPYIDSYPTNFEGTTDFAGRLGMMGVILPRRATGMADLHRVSSGEKTQSRRIPAELFLLRRLQSCKTVGIVIKTTLF